MEQMGNEEIISILGSTVAWNRALEGEVRTLMRRLEDVRAPIAPFSNAPSARRTV